METCQHVRQTSNNQRYSETNQMRRKLEVNPKRYTFLHIQSLTRTARWHIATCFQAVSLQKPNAKISLYQDYLRNTLQSSLDINGWIVLLRKQKQNSYNRNGVFFFKLKGFPQFTQFFPSFSRDKVELQTV